MLHKKQFLKLTGREMDIMNILWNSQKPLIASVYKGIHIKTTKNGLPTY